MPRNMSAIHTKQQVYNRTKTVTRRKGWANLKPGEEFWMVEKGQGLKKGEKIKRIALCRCVSNRAERLDRMIFEPIYGLVEAELEGFPYMTGHGFVEMFCRHMGGEADQMVNRIEFEYV